MIWYWCEHCSSWFITSATTVVRCPKCGADIYSKWENKRGRKKGRIVDENYEPIYCDALEDEHEYVGKKLDLVEVVRCKDCLYYEPEVDDLHISNCQRLWGGMIECKSYSYCSDGLRKDEVKNG